MHKRTVATPKQTSGAGFVFEDKVVAYYLSWMLLGGAPFKPFELPISRVDCQTRVDGWLLDDMLLTCSGGGKIYRYAFSIKSNLQFSRNHAPKDFVQDIWLQYLRDGSETFLSESDWLGLICIPQPDPPRTAIHSLLKKAHNQLSSQLSSRIDEKGYASDDERKLFKSFACPENLARKHNISDEHIGDLLKRVFILDHDFEDLESKDEGTAIFICQQLLEDALPNVGENLWQKLCEIAQRLRTSGGGISREELRAEVRSKFAIRDFPDFASDWHRLRTWCGNELLLVPDRIGGTVRIERQEYLDKVIAAIKDNNFTVLLGASGTGKSVIAKQVAENYTDSANVIWLRGGKLREGYFESFANNLGLHHSLGDVLTNAKLGNGLLVIDGIEKLVEEEQFRELILLLQLLEVGKPHSGWHVLLVGRVEEWERIQIDFPRYFGEPIVWNTVLLRAFNFDELQPLWNKYPSLRILAIRPHLREFLRNAKVLDILASTINLGHELVNRTWIGESDIIKWYWKTVVRGGHQGAARSALLIYMAEMEANDGRFEIPETKLSLEQLNIVPSASEILQVDQVRSTISFTHDLFADWARFYAILLHEDSLSEYLKDKMANPHWHKSLRLYGIKLLEEDETGNIWHKKLGDLPEIRNTLLESLALAGNSQQLLSNTWSILIAENGYLLKDLIKRFLYVTTIPNPSYVQIAQEVGATETEARTWERVPLWIYWQEILRFLASRSNEVAELAPLETALVAHTWLRHTPLDWPWRDHAADLALATAWHTFRTRPYYHRSNNELTTSYKAALEAFHDKPNDVRHFALKACSRIPPEEKDGKPFHDYEVPGTVRESASVIAGGPLVTQEPWSDGPLYRVDDVFRAVCFNSDALRLIMEDEPYLAKEILLALLISARPPKGLYWHDEDYSFIPGRGLALIDDSLFYPRFYTRGPFLLFLNVNPQVALETMITLIDFATNRRVEAQSKKQQGSIGIELGLASGQKLFVGDEDVFHWYHAISGSHLTGSILMAVEKWFYNLIDKKEAVEKWITLILEQAKSLAWIGVLSEIGRYSPHLFATVLQPLLLVPDSYYLERMYERRGGLQFGTPHSLHEGEWFWKLARNWDNMEHRRYGLINIAAQLFYSHEDTNKAISINLENWHKKKWDGNEDWNNFVEILIETFNQDNWKEVQLDDGTQVLAFQTPERLQPSTEQQEISRKQYLAMTRPIECRKLLDDKQLLDESRIQGFIDGTKSIADIQYDDPDRTSLYASAHSVAGTIAVLVQLHRDWLKSHPAEENWCVAKLIDIFNNPPKWPEFDVPESVGSYSWEHFVCEAVPVFWSENPDVKKWREFVANLVFVRHYGALQILLKRSFEKREPLADSFSELVAFVLDWIILAYEIRVHKTSHKIPSWHNKAIRKFVSHRYSLSFLEWGKTAIEKSELRVNYDHSGFVRENDARLYNRIAHVDFTQIQIVFSDIFRPDQAIDDNEREQFFLFWDQALLFSLIRTEYLDESGNELATDSIEAPLPYDYDYWILEKAATIILQIRQDENADRYWKPILSLGPRADHWIERFLSHWFMDRRKNGNIDDFLYHWQSMINYCLASEDWTTHKQFYSYHIPDLWSNLFGFTSFGGSLWEAMDEEIIYKMRSHFVKAIPYIFRDPSCAARVISWLGKKSSGSSLIRVLMLKPMSQAIKRRSEEWFQEERLLSALSSYLNVLWDEHRQELRTVRKEFEELLHKIATYHEPLALELQSRISSRN